MYVDLISGMVVIFETRKDHYFDNDFTPYQHNGTRNIKLGEGN